MEFGLGGFKRGGSGGEFVGEGFPTEGFPAGFELGDLLGKSLPLLENGAGVVEIAQGVAVERGLEGTAGVLLLKAGVGQRGAAAGPY